MDKLEEYFKLNREAFDDQEIPELVGNEYLESRWIS